MADFDRKVHPELIAPRQNVMKQAASIKALELGRPLPGIKITKSATHFAPISHRPRPF
jgi:hypothetical protein